MSHWHDFDIILDLTLKVQQLNQNNNENILQTPCTAVGGEEDYKNNIPSNLNLLLYINIYINNN
jgi:hypothetical protein